MQSNPLSKQKIHPAFVLKRQDDIPTLKLRVLEFEHTVTGARYIHLESPDQENAFTVAFRTIPKDSTGAAHILEHTVLCGSQRFPVRDPFFLMTRRSLATFMNAMTADDWTAYPFSSQNPKDFDNLLQVYLDAVFFPKLNPLDFAQEGHHLEFSEPTNPATPAVLKGVVFNEMKGAFSAPHTQVWQRLQAGLLPNTPYRFDSGGEPAHIPDLTYEALKAFHSEHYHPSNAVFVTYGNLPVLSLQTSIQNLALQHFQRQSRPAPANLEPWWTAPQRLHDTYVFDSEESPKDKTFVVLGWVLGERTQMETVLKMRLLVTLLLNTSASPLQRALETTDLGSSPFGYTGLDSEKRQMLFVCGLEGSSPEKADAVEQMILQVLDEVAQHGLPNQDVDAALHALEFSQREVGGSGGVPNQGLKLIFRSLPTFLAAELSASEALHIEPLLEKLRRESGNPNFVKHLANELRHNPHRLCLVMTPDPNKGAQLAQAEQQRVQHYAAHLSAQEQQNVIAATLALEQRQDAPVDPNVLPKVELCDVPKHWKFPEAEQQPVADFSTHWFHAHTNGISYLQAWLPLPETPMEQTEQWSLFADFLTEVGSGQRDYLATQQQQALVTGGFKAFLSMMLGKDSLINCRTALGLSTKCLHANLAPTIDLINDTLWHVQFHELDRLAILVEQAWASEEAAMTQIGHRHALRAAAAGFTPVAAWNHAWDGLAGSRRLKKIKQLLAQPATVKQFSLNLNTMCQALQTIKPIFVVVTEEEQRVSLQQQLNKIMGQVPSQRQAGSLFDPKITIDHTRIGYTINSSVNFCAQAYLGPPASHPDAPAMLVLGKFLQNGFLHSVIREKGGAYGSGASFDSSAGIFAMHSYRDPRTVETFADFDRAVAWMLETKHPQEKLDEAILGIMAQIDAPGSPAQEALMAFYFAFHDRQGDFRKQLREAVLSIQLNDLHRVTETYLKDNLKSLAVVGHAPQVKMCENLGFVTSSI